MSIIPHQKRYLPHEIGTRIHAVTLYRSAKDIEFVCRRYKISKASLMRWNKRYDGTPESLADRSHRPHTVHPRAHTNEEIMWVLNLVRRNPDITLCELYGKLRRKHRYTRPPLFIPALRASWIAQEARIYEEEAYSSALRYANVHRHEVADGCKVRSEGLLCG